LVVNKKNKKQKLRTTINNGMTTMSKDYGDTKKKANDFNIDENTAYPRRQY